MAMNRLEKISKHLEVAESKKNILEESILLLLAQCKDFGGQLDLTHKDFSEVFRELDFREKKLNSEKELLEQRLKEVGNKEKDFALFREKKIRALELREAEIFRSRDVYMKEIVEVISEKEKKMEELMNKLKYEKIEKEERIKEIELEEKFLEGKRDDIELIRISIEKRSKELEHMEGKIKEREKKVEVKEEEMYLWKARYDEIQLKEKQLQAMIGDLEFQEKSNDFIRLLNEAKLKELDVKEKQLEEKFKKALRDLESKRKEFEVRVEEFEERAKQLGLKEKELQESFEQFRVKEKRFRPEKKVLEKESKHLESRRKELEESIKKFELREKELESKEEHFQAEKKLLENESKDLESREKELELKENQLKSVSLKTEEIQDVNGQCSLSNSTDLDIRSLVMMNGKDLQIFLNEHEKDRDLMVDKVFEALQLSKDPAKLVLSAMEGFFPPRLRKENKTFSGYVVKRSCMLLLQQLSRISPHIQARVKDEALKLAREWKAKIMISNSLEVSSFLYLLASYNVAAAFDADDIMRCLKFASLHQLKLEPKFCCRLGLKDKIPNLIEHLLKKNQYFEAIKFIYGFEVVDCFPPVPILENYLDHVKMSAVAMLKKRRNTEKAQIEYIDTRVAAIRSVIRCIVDYKLESQISLKELENTEKRLRMLKGDKNFTRSSNSHESQGQQKVEVKRISCTAAPPSRPYTSRIIAEVSPHPMAIIIANMDGKNLLSFLSSHVVEHELLQNEVSSALQISDNSPKLVLDAVESLYNSHQSENETKSCIFLLKQLIGLSPDVIPDVKEAAEKIAFNLEGKLKAENGNLLLISMFLLLVKSYRLSSAFQRNELSDLYQRVVKHSPGLFHTLRTSKEIYTDGAAPASQVDTQKSESKSLLQVKNLAVSSPMVPELDVESLHTNMDSEGEERVSNRSEVSAYIYQSSDPADLMLDALRNCHQSNFTKNKNPQLVFNSFYCLLEQLMNVSLEIRPDVKGRAYEFARDWKAKSNVLHSWEALGFLQLVATYQLSSEFSSDELFGLLEVVCQPKKASSLIRMFGFVDKVPGFISQLIRKKKFLQAFAYVYDFKLIEMFPPVALLKQHIRYSKLLAKNICKEERNTPEAQDNALVSEIAALKTVIKLIRQHNLRSQYSPDELLSTVEQLESQREKLNTSTQKVNANVLAPEDQVQLVDTKKRPACEAEDATCTCEAHLQPANKIPRSVSPSHFITGRVPIRSEPGTSPGLAESSPSRLPESVLRTKEV